MKTTLTLILILLLAGCTQIIIEKPDGTKLKANSLFKSIASDEAYWDGDLFILSKFKSVPSDIELVYDPLTGRIKAKAKANEPE